MAATCNVTLHHSVWSDVRYQVLARQLGLVDHYAVIGRMAQLWSECTDRQTDTPPMAVVLGCLGISDERQAVTALVASDLAQVIGDQIRIKGCQGRIDWIQKKRASGRAGGLAKASSALANASTALAKLGFRQESSQKDEPISCETVALAKHSLSETLAEAYPQVLRYSGTQVLTNSETHTPRAGGTLVERAWQIVANSYRDASGAEPSARPWPLFVVGHEASTLCSELLSRLGGDESQVLEAIQHVANLKAIQALELGHLRFFTPSRFWEPKSFQKVLELSAEQMRDESRLAAKKSDRAKTDPRVGRIDPNPRKFDDIAEGTHEL